MYKLFKIAITLGILLCLSSCNILRVIKSAFKKNKLKSEILQLCKSLDRGLKDDPVKEKKMQTLFKELEDLDLNKSSLSNPSLSGTWNLEYTSSATLIGKGQPGRRKGAIQQKINVKDLRAENSEELSLFGLPKITNSVTASLEPVSKSKVDVTFDCFKIGKVKLVTPKGYRAGFIDVTYLDDDFRLTRGDKGNIFVLTKQKGTSAKNTPLKKYF